MSSSTDRPGWRRSSPRVMLLKEAQPAPWFPPPPPRARIWIRPQSRRAAGLSCLSSLCPRRRWPAESPIHVVSECYRRARLSVASRLTPSSRENGAPWHDETSNSYFIFSSYLVSYLLDIASFLIKSQVQDWSKRKGREIENLDRTYLDDQAIFLRPIIHYFQNLQGREIWVPQYG